MPIYALGDVVPSIDELAYVHPQAVVIGDVTIGPESSLWPGAVLRGDSGRIVVGAGTNIQDGAIIHTTTENPTIIGDRCTIGHLAHLEGCRTLEGALIGSAAVVLHAAVIGEWALVGANAVVPGGMVVPPGALAVGVPAKVRGEADRREIEEGLENYIEKARHYRVDLRRID